MKYKSVDVIEVMYKGHSVGALALDPSSDYYAFEYNPDFINTGIELAPLTLPLTRQTPVIFPYLPQATYYRLPAFVADSLPDAFGNALIDVWMARNGILKNQISILDRLAYIGERGMGALEFKPMIKIGDQNPSALEMNRLVSTARKAVQIDLNEEDKSDANDAAIKQLISVGTSAGGARAKAVIGYNPKNNEFISGQFDLPEGFEHWLIKFDIPEQERFAGRREYGKIEYAYYLMAKECGIQMSECRLLQIDDSFHFMTKRFDREADEKIHMQTLCAMAELDYNQKQTHDYVQFFQTAQQMELGYDTIDQIFTRMAFNVIMGNNDDHTKNHAFLLKENSWKLSPAYDLTFAMNSDSEWLSRHLMGVNGKFIDITRDDMVSLGRKFFVRNPDEILNRVIEISKKWDEFALEANLSDSEINRIKIAISGLIV